SRLGVVAPRRAAGSLVHPRRRADPGGDRAQDVVRLARDGRGKSMMRARYRWLLALDLLFVALWIVFGHVRALHAPGTSHPAIGYADALERLAKLRDRDDSTINPECHTILWTHGQKVEHAIVLLHGFTNCPK